MGGWISLIVGKKNTQTIHGLIGIASAPDFVVGEWNRLSTEQQTKIKKEGQIIINWDDYDEDYIITYKFLEDGMKNILLKDSIPITCPIRLLHGKLDKVVSTDVSQTIIEKIESRNKELIVIEDGDHSLSRNADLKLLFDKIEELI
jgi:alpha-beta hydrolase superfamily lysophospholipase